MLNVIATLWLWIFIFTLAITIYGFFIKDKHRLLKEKPTVTAVVAAWNEGQRLKHCIDSILANDYPKDKLSVIVVAGGSDETVEICKKFQREGKIKFIHERKRQGKWAALNEAIDNITTEVAAFTDADCVVSKNWISELVKHSADVDFVSGDIRAYKPKSVFAKMYSNYFFLVNYSLFALSRIFNFSHFTGQNFLAKSYVFKELRFRKSIADDLSFGYDAEKLGMTIRKVHSPVVYAGVSTTWEGIHAQLLRLLNGLYRDIPVSFLGIATFAITISSLFSLPTFLYGLITFEKFTIFSVAVAIVMLILTYIAALVKHKETSVIYLPYMPIIYFIFALASLEAVFDIIFRRKVEWKILDKVVE